MKKTKTTSKKTTKKELLAAMKQRKTTQEALWKELSKAWGEIHELKRSAQEHRAKIHNLNGDTATLFDRTKSLQTSNTSLLTRVFTCWK